MYTRISTSQFPVSKEQGDFVPGTVVSLNSDGVLIKQSGTTVYKNQHIFNRMMLDSQAISLANDIFVVVYHGHVVVIKLGAHDQVIEEKLFELPTGQVGKQRDVDCAIRVPNTNVILVLGNSEVIPVRIVYTSPGFFYEYGDPQLYYFSPLDLRPKITVDGNRFAILFTDNDYFTRLMTGTIDVESLRVEMTTDDIVIEEQTVYSIAYIQHSVIGLVYAVNMNGTFIQSAMGFESVDETGKYSISLKESSEIECVHPVSFLEMGSWNRFQQDNSNVIVTFITDDEADGLIIRHLRFEQVTQSLRLGPRMNNKNSGVSDIDTHGIHHLSILMMENNKFMVGLEGGGQRQVYYSSIINKGFTALQLYDLTPTFELMNDGPQFIVSRGISDIVVLEDIGHE